MKIMGVDVKKLFQDIGNLKSLYEEIVNFRNDHKNDCPSVAGCDAEIAVDICSYSDRIDCSYDLGYVRACDDILALIMEKMKGVSNEM